jgi:dephospho-CoA kinase
MKYLITGVAGTGKSSVAKELQKRGLAAYDADAGFSYYANKETGEKAVRPANPTLEWYDCHHRIFNENVLNNLFKKHRGETLFICSITANQAKFYGDFDKIFLLSAPDETIVERLQTRTNNHFGKHPLELERVITRHQEFDDELKAVGAIVIDSTRPIEAVVKEILEQAK